MELSYAFGMSCPNLEYYTYDIRHYDVFCRMLKIIQLGFIDIH